jgi:hypothetical protein
VRSFAAAQPRSFPACHGRDLGGAANAGDRRIPPAELPFSAGALSPGVMGFEVRHLGQAARGLRVRAAAEQSRFAVLLGRLAMAGAAMGEAPAVLNPERTGRGSGDWSGVDVAALASLGLLRAHPWTMDYRAQRLWLGD